MMAGLSETGSDLSETGHSSCASKASYLDLPVGRAGSQRYRSPAGTGCRRRASHADGDRDSRSNGQETHSYSISAVLGNVDDVGGVVWWPLRGLLYSAPGARWRKSVSSGRALPELGKRPGMAYRTRKP